MREITLEQPIETLQVNIGKESFSIPLAGSLPFKEALSFRKSAESDRMELLIGFLEEHIPEPIFNRLTAKEVEQIIKAWSDASQEATGATPGES